TVKMTEMPQLVGIFNGLGGGASAVVAAAEFLRIFGGDEAPLAAVVEDAAAQIGTAAEVAPSLDVASGATMMASTLIGAVTLSGSFVAFGKLQGIVTGNPVTYPLQRTLNLLLFLGILGLSFHQAVLAPDPVIFLVLAALALLLGILLVIPIGGADMPVVISLLNSYSGLAASAAGFVLGNMILIIAGALVGAAGLILTNLMCRAMNRSLANVAFGAFGGATAIAAGSDEEEKQVTSVDAEQVATILAYARNVVFVPGYGLAVAQAQHDLKRVFDILGDRGVEVRFAIHPVAGRMPGHMNVLLAEADVPYNRLLDLEEINPDFPRTEVVVVVGANDVVNPAAREPDSVISGMPILDVDEARTVIVMKRSLSPGFAGIDNELFYMDNTMMFFGDAQEKMQDLVKELREL
ncbi:MAG: NAD(P)(+) transhydrogenase (Re/Si-specific) subunit beta, partial [Gemmatimonadota bacterium]